jgi:hypothetical protein
MGQKEVAGGRGGQLFYGMHGLGENFEVKISSNRKLEGKTVIFALPGHSQTPGLVLPTHATADDKKKRKL